MTARDIMTPDPACCTQDTSLQQAAKMMRDLNVGSIPVVSDMTSRRIIGMVTDRDIVIRSVADGGDCTGTMVAHCMTTEISTCRESESLQACLDRMEDRQVRRMPVVNEENCLVGIIAQADVAMAAGDQKTAELVEKVSRPYLH